MGERKMSVVGYELHPTEDNGAIAVCVVRGRCPSIVSDEVADLLQALVRLAKARSNHGRRRTKAEVRHAARVLLAEVEARWPVERKASRRIGRLDPAAKARRLRARGWAPESELEHHTLQTLLSRAALLGVPPAYLGGDPWFPRWLDAEVLMSDLRRMKRDVRYRKAKMAELYCKGAP